MRSISHFFLFLSKKIARYYKKRRLKVLIIIGIIIGYCVLNFLIFSIFKVLPDFAYYLLPKLEDIQNSQRILIISPHPDDEILNTGGFIQKALNNHSQIIILLVTDGNKHKIGKIRINEFKKAATFLGVKEENLILLNLKDGSLHQYPSSYLKNLLLNIVTSFNPEVIVYPSPYDTHPDHKTIGILIEEIYKNNNKIRKISYLTHFKGYPQPRKLKTKEFLLPPYALAFACQWKIVDLEEKEIINKKEALKIYNISVAFPLEKSFLFSFIRKNELFCEN